MNHHDVFSDGLSDFVVKRHTDEEVLCYCLQGIFGPGEEPIDRCVRDETGEVTAANSKSITSR